MQLRRTKQGFLIAVAMYVSVAAHADFVDRFQGEELVSLFSSVAETVLFEPYAGALRGADGTAAHGSGNSVDQSLLLAEVLRRRGFRVRFVHGQLDDSNLAVLLRSAFPPTIPHQPIQDVTDVYVPEHDPSLRALVAYHTWIEIDQGDSWLPLDPSYPRASAGEAYAVASFRTASISDEQFARIRIEFIERSGAGERVLVAIDETVASLLLKPVSFAETRVPLRAASGAKEQGGVRTLFGEALSGGPSEEEPAGEVSDVPNGALLLRSLRIGDRELSVPPLLIQEEDSKTHLLGESIKVTITQPGRAELVSERAIYRQQNRQAWPDEAFRRHTIAVIGGRVGQEILRAANARVRRIEAPQFAAPDAEAAQQLMDLESKNAPSVGYALLAIHANAVDEISDRLGWFAGAQWFYSAPRVYLFDLKVSSADDTASVETAIDLRIDQAVAVPFPDRPRTASALMQRARGFLAATTEAEVLEAATGQPVHANTMRVLDTVTLNGVGLLVAEPGTRPPAVDGVDRATMDLIRDALSSGRRVFYPASPVSIGGTNQFGWFEEDTESGAWVGVMADGRHQALASYELTLEKSATDPDMAFALGANSGAINTVNLIVAFILKDGVITAATIKKIEDMVNAMACAACPGEVSAGLGGEVQLAGDCLKMNFKPKLQPTGASDAPGPADFCSSYQDGVKCATQALLAALKGEAMATGASAAFKAGNCALHIQLGRKWNAQTGEFEEPPPPIGSDIANLND